MDKETFKALSIQEKLKEIKASGRLVAQKDYYQQLVSLYLLSGFLVEVFYLVGRQMANS